ncbi:hypothetical protein LXJ15735_33160 [Lacrimispora xylanolytica]
MANTSYLSVKTGFLWLILGWNIYNGSKSMSQNDADIAKIRLKSNHDTTTDSRRISILM